MTRRTVLLAVAVTAVLSLAFQPELARSEAVIDGPGDMKSLVDRLTTGLRIKAPRDIRFVERVAEHVHAGRLPQHVVDSTYLWAVRRGRKHPFPAFEHVIRLQAGKLGVPLD